ncbi:unnamed protein product [Acanthoscelides obtectus]|uniref:Elongation of very long chain fatty acids protein n=2 Tax=Acanthoscelides obtectus TaxID=200917 RepID=A0A9P0Q8K2_ACAOB|nr:unnamed protein product [Acanthoscelides obtectus]CAK1621110.1 Elongation of very long chain fatty acids protein 7 [Acanthoscelides obtectus]
MALVLKKIYHLFLSAEELSDQRLKDAWVLGKPIQLLALTAIYLYFVKKLGPQLMEKRKPLEIKKIMMAYDILQVVLNAYVSWEALLSLLKGNWKCNAIDYSDDPFALRQLWIGKCYFWLKILDLFDTVFFVLRKSYRQISFLHLYHHSVMLLGMWYGVTYFCGGDSLWVACVNGFVHTIMFLYYFLAAYDASWKNNLTVKKTLTQIQLVQFLFFTLKFSQLFIQKDCMYPKIASILFVPQNLFMSALFMDFYLKSYVYKVKKS